MFGERDKADFEHPLTRITPMRLRRRREVCKLPRERCGGQFAKGFQCLTPPYQRISLGDSVPFKQ